MSRPVETLPQFEAYLAEAEAVLRKHGGRPHGRMENVGADRPSRAVLVWKIGWRIATDYVV